MDKYLINSTIKATWISSGVTPSSILHMVYDGSETLVHSASMTSSGNGHYYDPFSVSSPGYYASETKATVDSNPYRKRVKFKAVLIEVD